MGKYGVTASAQCLVTISLSSLGAMGTADGELERKLSFHML